VAKGRWRASETVVVVGGRERESLAQTDAHAAAAVPCLEQAHDTQRGQDRGPGEREGGRQAGSGRGRAQRAEK